MHGITYYEWKGYLEDEKLLAKNINLVPQILNESETPST